MEDDKFSVNSDTESESGSESSVVVGAAGKKKQVKKSASADDSDISDVESEIADSDVESEPESDAEEETDEMPLPKRSADATNFPELDSDEDVDDEDEDYLQKLNEDVTHNILQDHHPELMVNNYEEIETLCTIVKDENGNIVDPFHKTLPFVTRYEKARVLGERAKQLNAGAAAFVDLEPDIIDGELIALREFEAKKIPFIVQRPLPNGGCEYWRLKDLEIL